ncbi:MAG: hypothetical protein ABIA93_04555 [Candidatus Woesearchaeota archaeon]
MVKSRMMSFSAKQLKMWALSAMSAGITSLLFVIFFPVIPLSVYFSLLFAVYALLVGSVVLLILRTKRTTDYNSEFGRALSGVVSAVLVLFSWIQYISSTDVYGVYVPGRFPFPSLTVLGLLITLFLSVPVIKLFGSKARS